MLSGTKSFCSVDFPAPFLPIIPTTPALLHIKRHILRALKNSSEGGARINRTNGAFTGLTFRIAEREILFLRSTDMVFLAPGL